MSTDTTAKKGGFRLFEKGPGFKSGLKDLMKYTNGATLSSAIISTIFGCTGPCLVTIAASEARWTLSSSAAATAATTPTRTTPSLRPT